MDPATALQQATVRLEALGLNTGTSGNVSIRVAGGFLVTPSAIPPDRLLPGDMVELTLTGENVSGGVPSSEWRIHRDVYGAFPEAGAIVHTHSIHATALAVLREDLPPFHYLVAKAGGRSIRCADFAGYGTQALSDAVVQSLEGRRACLMANHGMLAHGTDLAAAMALAVDVEVLCRQYLVARSSGSPVLLTDAQVDEAIARFQRYGLPEAGSP